jgi:hypothetical protein
MAGFEVIIYGRFWVITEDHTNLLAYWILMGGNRTLPPGLLHIVKDLAGYLGGTYMIGPSASAFLMFSILFLRASSIELSTARIWSRAPPDSK